MKPRVMLPLLLCLGLAWLAPDARAGRPEKVKFLDKEFMVYWVDLATDDLSLSWRDAQGKPLEKFSRLREHLRPREVKFAINAGIFTPANEPLGLHIENARELRPLNLGKLEGGQFNFYLKPNGVFYVLSNRAAVVESAQFAALKIQPWLACQSGPLLLTNGVIHPEFRPASSNLFYRTGVGVAADGKVVFALTLQRSRFHDFARLFKERLGCDNALYLDGEICGIYLPELRFTRDAAASYAAMFAVSEKPKQ
jgi:uncharacterized protein YigE (DUF2233 family)